MKIRREKPNLFVEKEKAGQSTERLSSKKQRKRKSDLRLISARNKSTGRARLYDGVTSTQKKKAPKKKQKSIDSGCQIVANTKERAVLEPTPVKLKKNQLAEGTKKKKTGRRISGRPARSEKKQLKIIKKNTPGDRRPKNRKLCREEIVKVIRGSVGGGRNSGGGGKG